MPDAMPADRAGIVRALAATHLRTIQYQRPKVLTVKTLSPQPFPQGERASGRDRCNGVPSPRWGEGQGEGDLESKMRAVGIRYCLGSRFRANDGNISRYYPIRVLATGFGPFPGVPANASGLLVSALQESKPLPGLELHTAIVPVVWSEAWAAAQGAIAKVRPHAILHFGVARRATVLEIETRAINRSGIKEDHAGAVRPAMPLDRSGPPAMASTLPPLLMLRALRLNGFPAQLSKNAGRYLCNALLYWSLCDARKSGSLVTFIHMPALGTATDVKQRVTFDECVNAGRVLVAASAQAVRHHRRALSSAHLERP